MAKRRTKMGHVYFIRAECDPPLIKIGFTAGTPVDRFLRHRVSSPVDLSPLAIMRGSIEDERDLHLRFADDWSHGEWFRPSEALLSYIAIHTRKWDARKPDFVRRPVSGLPLPPAQTIEEWAKATTWTFEGWTRTVAQWSKATGLSPMKIRNAIQNPHEPRMDLRVKARVHLHKLPYFPRRDMPVPRRLAEPATSTV